MVAFGDSAANPPEVNYWTLMTGDHGASATAAAAAHQALADTMATTMGLTEGNAASTAAGGWQGVGGVSMLANATEMTGVMAMAVAWLQEGSILAAQIVDAYTLALESMIPGEVCTTNRTTQAGLIATNIGQNTPAIIALEVEYRGHWIQNASMMAGYQAVVSAALAALATPPPINPAVANPAGPLAGVAQAGAETAAGSLQAGFQSVTPDRGHRRTGDAGSGQRGHRRHVAGDEHADADGRSIRSDGRPVAPNARAGTAIAQPGRSAADGHARSARQRGRSGRRRPGGRGQHGHPVECGHVDRWCRPRRWRRWYR